MGRRRQWPAALLLSMAIGVLSGDAGAQSDEDKARARELALETGDLLDEGKFGQALDRIEEAERLYHAPTHLQMKGEALEGLGRLAEAMRVYERLVAEPIPSAATDAFRAAKEFATDRLRELIARVPSVKVTVRGADPSAVTVTLDGEPYPLGGEAVRVDAGDHQVTVSAEGFASAERSVTLDERGGVRVVDVVLTPIGEDPAPVVDDEPIADQPDDAGDEEAGGSLWPAAIAFGVGGVALTIGTITGAMSLSQVGDLEDACPDKQCSEEQQADIDAVETLGNVSTASFVIGGVGIGAGIVLLLLTPGDDEQAALAPWVGPTFAGVRGTF